jgi:nitroreductase/Pyruvate/2-oxoacid:ferredoxin oxidoreductase delta subunit
MKAISINEEKCTNCSLCSLLCPARIICDSKETEVATVNPEMEAMCSRCGHCEAYCPEEAIKINYPGAKQFDGVVPNRTITPEQIKYHMSNRRSVRYFKQTPIDKKILEELMEIVRYAPTGANAQNVNWIIVHDPEQLKKLLSIAVSWAKSKLEQEPDNPGLIFLKQIVISWENGVDMICRNAPNLAIAYVPVDVLSSSIDAIIATTYLELAAPVYGVGTCWGGFFQIIASASEELRSALGIPEGHAVGGALMLGYPHFKQQRIPKRNAGKVRLM